MIFVMNSLWIIELALGANVIMSVVGITSLSTIGIALSILLIVGSKVFKLSNGYYKQRNSFLNYDCVDCGCEGLDCSTQLALNELLNSDLFNCDSVDCELPSCDSLDCELPSCDSLDCDAADCLDIDCG